MKIAVDLLWLRPGKVGGTEFFIRNLLDGFLELQDEYHFVLIVSTDNADTFKQYEVDDRFELLVVNIESGNIAKRILWQLMWQNKLLRKHKLFHCFVPVYCRPFTDGKITYINTIHDIQVYHYPKYHPLHEILYTKVCWWIDFRKSKKLVAISEYVKNDIMKQYGVNSDRIEVIYNSIQVEDKSTVTEKELYNKWTVKKNEYYYTVAQMIPHKNIETLLKVFAEMKKENISLPLKLLITGINGNATENIRKLIGEYEIENCIVLTGFISNEERNALYMNCKAFLFPSIFEGFGMPAVEAMALGATVITTNRTSIPEVTQNNACYVENPFSVKQWIDKMQDSDQDNIQQSIDMSVYHKKVAAKKYLELLNNQFVTPT